MVIILLCLLIFILLYRSGGGNMIWLLSGLSAFCASAILHKQLCEHPGGHFCCRSLYSVPFLHLNYFIAGLLGSRGVVSASQNYSMLGRCCNWQLCYRSRTPSLFETPFAALTELLAGDGPSWVVGRNVNHFYLGENTHRRTCHEYQLCRRRFWLVP